MTEFMCDAHMDDFGSILKMLLILDSVPARYRRCPWRVCYNNERTIATYLLGEVPLYVLVKVPFIQGDEF